MRLQHLYLRNFRNFKEASLSFGSKINVFCGNNAQGKTNLLEAIILVSTGRSFRTPHLTELIRDGESFFFLEAQILQDHVVQIVRLSFDGKSKRVECNQSSYPSFQSLLGLLPSIVFAPSDIDLIIGSPAVRRRFLNLHLAQSDPQYFHHFLRFWRAVKQRNAMLRAESFDGIDCWETVMAESASYIFEKRKLLIEEINTGLQMTCKTLSSEKTEITFIPSQPMQQPLHESYLAQLKKNRIREKQWGITMTGPHRDDFTLLIDDKPARLYASDGQKRTAIAALRLAEWHRLQKQTETTPLFGIDDLELHLDQQRLNLFRQSVEKLGQVFITTPQPDLVWPQAKLHRVIAGSATPL